MTSPPYWGLRDYGLSPAVWGGDPDHAHEWGDDVGERHSSPQQSRNGQRGVLGPRDMHPSASRTAFSVSMGAFCPCGAWRGTLGLEPTPDLYVAHMVTVFREIKRVLRDDGTCWLNLGDSYAQSSARAGQDNSAHEYDHANAAFRDVRYSGGVNISAKAAGLKPKDLVGIPWRVAFALQADGWYLRSDIVWSKPNPMPESVTDRPTKAHEYLFLLTKAARYYYDAEAVKEPSLPSSMARYQYADEGTTRINKGGAYREKWNEGDKYIGVPTVPDNPASRNRRSVWTIATQPYPEAHFATFPEALVEPCILAGTSARGACPACGAPWGRVVEAESPDGRRAIMRGGKAYDSDGRPLMGDNMIDHGARGSWNSGGATLTRRTAGWSPTCPCPPADPVPCRVLDPFSGSGTTVAVAERLGRVGVGLELKADYLALARKRTVQAALL